MPDKTKNPAHPVSAALRAAGFKPLPRLWVKAEEMCEILEKAYQHAEEVTGIRAQVRRTHNIDPPASKKIDRAREDRDAAWELYEKTRARS